MDETGINCLDKVVARKDYKQIGIIISVERNLVTVACAVSAIRNQIPFFL